MQFIDLDISFNCSDFHGEVRQCYVTGVSAAVFILLIFSLGFSSIIKIMIACNMYINSINLIQETLIGHSCRKKRLNVQIVCKTPINI